MPGALEQAAALAAVAKAETTQQSNTPPVGQVTLILRKVGWHAATLGAYVKAMQQPVGVGQSPESHLRYFQKEFGFYGTPQKDGSLEIDGVKYLWDGKQLKADGQPVAAPPSSKPTVTKLTGQIL